MPYIAAVIKWTVENPKAVRYGLMALGAVVIIGWVYHRGSTNAARQDAAVAVEAAVTVKEQYDEISNHRPDDLSLLDLMQHGAF